ncbi:Down syndrome cell adhesion molecule-like protein Dscam2 isoform X2 [Homarus americanus]|uniref:Down syndrome cell adhesion molecule-like protein Dscam2 isoform X2 n=1 Tax=Homarus americanus TaxID=6706 RepID=UPI001C4725CE|nr:Down syndrome cell adhesion molecule-like protein Dscam2 isoform X2 [Homarus americanus]
MVETRNSPTYPPPSVFLHHIYSPTSLHRPLQYSPASLLQHTYSTKVLHQSRERQQSPPLVSPTLHQSPHPVSDALPGNHHYQSPLLQSPPHSGRLQQLQGGLKKTGFRFEMEKKRERSEEEEEEMVERMSEEDEQKEKERETGEEEEKAERESDEGEKLLAGVNSLKSQPSGNWPQATGGDEDDDGGGGREGREEKTRENSRRERKERKMDIERKDKDERRIEIEKQIKEERKRGENWKGNHYKERFLVSDLPLTSTLRRSEIKEEIPANDTEGKQKEDDKDGVKEGKDDEEGVKEGEDDEEGVKEGEDDEEGVKEGEDDEEGVKEDNNDKKVEEEKEFVEEDKEGVSEREIDSDEDKEHDKETKEEEKEGNTKDGDEIQIRQDTNNDNEDVRKKKEEKEEGENKREIKDRKKNIQEQEYEEPGTHKTHDKRGESIENTKQEEEGKQERDDNDENKATRSQHDRSQDINRTMIHPITSLENTSWLRSPSPTGRQDHAEPGLGDQLARDDTWQMDRLHHRVLSRGVERNKLVVRTRRSGQHLPSLPSLYLSPVTSLNFPSPVSSSTFSFPSSRHLSSSLPLSLSLEPPPPPASSSFSSSSSSSNDPSSTHPLQRPSSISPTTSSPQAPITTSTPTTTLPRLPTPSPCTDTLSPRLPTPPPRQFTPSLRLPTPSGGPGTPHKTGAQAVVRESSRRAETTAAVDDMQDRVVSDGSMTSSTNGVLLLPRYPLNPHPQPQISQQLLTSPQPLQPKSPPQSQQIPHTRTYPESWSVYRTHTQQPMPLQPQKPPQPPPQLTHSPPKQTSPQQQPQLPSQPIDHLHSALVPPPQEAQRRHQQLTQPRQYGPRLSSYEQETVISTGDGNTAYDGSAGHTVHEDSAVNMSQSISSDQHYLHDKKVYRRGGASVEVRISGLKRPSRDLGLNPYVRPESAPQLRYTPIEQTVSPGSPVSLKCSAMGAPEPVITWTRDHQPLLPSHRTSVGSFRTALGEVVSQVNLSSVTGREGGLYTCTASNTHGSLAHSARLNVYGPPFVRAMGNVTAVSGEDVQLWCPAGGYPTPTITWRRDGQILPTSLGQEVALNGTLVVREADHDDVGRYTCVVSGRQGQTASSHTFLHVLKPPKIEPFTFRNDLQEGERTQLTCMINSGDLPITLNWLKDGRHLQHDPGIDVKQTSDYSRVLLFKKLREHHSGTYTCEAANAAATANHTATVRVKVSPRWVVEPGSATALVGHTVVLDCSARGYPQPDLTWMKAPGDTAQDFQAVVLDGVRASQAPNGSLVLPSVTTTSAGWFLCRAANTVGKPISKVVQLTVHAPARVVTEGGRVTGHAGQTVTVDCEATGDDPLTITWQRHHAPVSPSHRTSVRESGGGGSVRAVLEIGIVTASDAGQYTCRAANPHGEHSQVFNIAVIEPPTAPAGVVVSEVGSRSARVTWTLPQPAAVTIQYRAEGESWATHGRNVSVGQWASWHVLTGLTPYHSYALRLMAHNDLGVSQPSSVQVFTTTEEAPTGAPRDVRVAAGSPRSLLVTWRAPDPHLTHGPLRGYTIALRRQNLQGHLTYITRAVATPLGDPESVEQYEVRGLTPASLYEVAVRAFTRAGPGPLSSPRIVDSTSHDAPSCPPAGVSCRGSGRGSVRVWWSPPPSHCVHAPVSGYTIVATPTKHTYHSGSSSTWEINTTNLEKNLDGLPPATNMSVRVKAFNEVGNSSPNHPVFCLTEDDVPGPPRRVRVIVTGSTTLLVTWSPPQPQTGTILHYTLYSARDDQVAVRDVVGAGGSEATWRELNNLTPASRVQVWVTATTVAGEGSQSPRLIAVPTPTPTHAPIAVGGGRSWWVGAGSGVTLGCRGLGSPLPTISWRKGSSNTITSSQHTQLLPGGDLHLTTVRETTNFTCLVRNSVGVDSLMHQVVAVTTPPPPTLTLAHATHHALNLSITPTGDGGAPILGYTVHHRQRAGEWVETSADPGVRTVMVRGLPCGAPHHLYLTAWNTHGTSTPSPVLLTNTLGSPPGSPNPAKLMEVNATCVTLRLYVWPELGCPVTHWKVELGSEEDEVTWTPLYAHVTRDITDLGICDLTTTSWHLLRITAASTAGDTSIVYRVAIGGYNGGEPPVQEVVVMGSPAVMTGWLDAHVVAGVVSAVLLAAALIICVCVAVRRRRPGESLDNKGGGEEDNARNSELTRAHLYSPTPTKKPHGSLASLKTQDDTSDPYEICPYATFSVGSSEGTLEYGLSLHAMTPRDCLDQPVHSERHTQQSPAYGQLGRQRAQSHYKETEIAYISNRNRGEYGSRPKSMPGGQPTPAPQPGEAVEQRAWPEESRKDSRTRPNRSRSRTRGAEAANRDSSTESNDPSSPVQQQRQHYQHPQMPPQPHHQQRPQQLASQQMVVSQHPQQLASQQQVTAGGRVGPHPLPPVRHARVRRDSSSSSGASSPLTPPRPRTPPPRPLHPPSAFSDSRELSETECDREMLSQAQASSNASQLRGRRINGKIGSDNMSANELAVLLQRYEQQQQQQQQEQQQQNAQQKHQQQPKLHRGTQKNPYSINV